MSLKDDQLLDALKVQLQIVGAHQVVNSLIATLHYKMVYRVQNHALDLAHTTSNEALLISVDSTKRMGLTEIPGYRFKDN